MVAEALREGVLDGLDPAEIAALVSCFTYERRGPDGDEPPPPPARWPTARCASRWRTIETVARQLSNNEHDAGLPETRPPDPGLRAATSTTWASGDELADVLDDDEITGGDFVRNVKQVIDLLRQIAEVAPDAATAATARAGAEAACRGRGRGHERGRDEPSVIRPGRAVGRAPPRGPADVEVAGGDPSSPRSSPRTPVPWCASCPTDEPTSPAPSGSRAAR